ncbi:MAG TPA: hypothetical protein DD417_15445, partial [Elusimicrobia bacterium]|nr:hypothetical protein [Elusimicrobiota bacterium]
MTRLVLTLLLASQAGLLWAAPQVAATHALRDGIGVSQPNALAYDPLRNELWVAGVNSSNLVVVDVAAGKPVLSIEGLGTVQQVALDIARDRVYALTNYRFVKALSASGRAPLKSIDVGYNRIVYGLAVDPASGRLFTVENVYDPQKTVYRKQLCRYDAETGLREASLDLGAPIFSGKGWNPVLDGNRLFLGLSFSSGSVYSGEVWTLDQDSLTVLQKVALGPASGPTSLALDPGDKTLYVGDLYSRLWVLKPSAAGPLVVASSRTLSSPGALALDPGRRRLYSAVTYSNEVQVLDSQTLQTLKILREGIGPAALAVGLDRSLAFAANTHSCDITVLDLAAQEAAGSISLRRDAPEDLAFDPRSSLALITSGLSNGLITWDRAAARETAFLPLSSGDPGGVVWFGELDKAFIRVGGSLRVFNTRNGSLTWPAASLGSIAELKSRRSGSELLVLQTYAPSPDYQKAALSLVDARSGALSKTVLLGPNSVYPKDVDDDPLTGKAYVTLYGANQVAVVDLASGVLLKTVPVGSYPWGVAVDPLRGRVYVANYGSNSLSVIDAASDTVIATLPVGKSPKGVDFKQRGARVYVVNSGQGTLSVIDARTLQTAATLPVGGFPRRVRVDQAAERAYVMGYSSASLTVVADPAPSEAVSAPKVLHSPVAGPVPEDQPVTVRAEVTDDDAVAVVTLTYWEAGRGRFVTVPMQPVAGATFEAKIPAEFLLGMEGASVSYFIDATDAAGNGPPTGTAPGSAAVPNTFTVRKSFTKLWSHTFGRIFGGPYRMIPGPSAAIGDVRPDLPGLEIATGNEEFFPLGNPGPAGRWFVFRPNGTVLFWKDTENDEAHSSVNLFDLDSDGKPEMLGGTTSGNEIQAFTGTGAWLWRFILGSHAISTPAVEVLTPGGAPRVFGGSFDTQFRAIDGKTGKLLWAYPAGDWIWSSPAVADLDGDGSREVVFATDGEQSLRPGVLHCLDAATGKLRWKQPLSQFVRASAAVADVDQDGVREVLIGSDDGVFRVFSGKDGTLEWSFATGGEILSSAAVGDLDGDGLPEIVFGSADGKVYALTGRGAIAWTRDLGAPVYSSPALARRVPGARLDVYAAAWDGSLHILSGADGRRLGGAFVGPYLASSPSVADIDGDGKLEVVLQDRTGDDADNQGDVFWALRDQESSVAPFAREWPMFRGAPAHTGVYAGAAAPAPVQDLPPAKVLGLAVLAPAEGGSLTLVWTADPELDIASYRIYRNGNFLTQVSTNAHADAGLTDGTTYTYRVSAVDQAGQEGPLSDPASGIPLTPPSVKILKPVNGATV